MATHVLLQSDTSQLAKAVEEEMLNRGMVVHLSPVAGIRYAYTVSFQDISGKKILVSKDNANPRSLNIGEVYGPGLPKEHSLAMSLLAGIVTDNRSQDISNSSLTVLSFNDAASLVTEAMLSLSDQQKTLGRKLSTRSFLNVSENIFANINKPSVDPFEESIREALLYMDKKMKAPKQKPPFRRTRYHTAALSLLIIALPFLLFHLTLFSIGAGIKLGLSNHDGLAKFAFKTGQATAATNRTISNAFSKVPVIPFYQTTAHVSGNLSKLGRIGFLLIDTRSLSQDLKSHLLSTGDIDVTETTQLLELNLSEVYSLSSFLESDLENYTRPLNITGFSLGDLKEARRMVLIAQEVAAGLDTLIAVETPRNYLILFQDSDQLRPSGGTITAFAIISLEDGRLVSADIQNVAEADNLLKGGVTPPKILADQTGIKKWSLKDSNWDTDFAVAAQQASWFIDKSLDIEIDGVVAVSSEFIGNSSDKNSVLLALESMWGKESELNTIELVSRFVSALDSNELQVSVFEKNLESIAQVAGWSDHVDGASCGTKCLTLTTGTFEANIGLNDANRHINRESELELRVINNTLLVTHSLWLANTASLDAYFPENKYKVYIRSIVPATAKDVLGTLITDLGEKNLDDNLVSRGDYSEFGALVTIPPGKNSSLVVSWTEDISDVDLVSINWERQSGVPGYPVKVVNGGDVLYNTSLSKDRTFFVNIEK